MRIAHFIALAAALVFSFTHADFASAQSGKIEDATLVEPGAKTGEVSTGQLRRILADGSAIVVDSRPRIQFESGHIPGAHVVDEKGDHVAAVARLVKGDKAVALVLYCNGPHCQASRRLGEQLVAAGFTNVRRYQLGLPVWRALGGPTAIELDGIVRIFKADRTAVFIDARPAEDFAKGSLLGARNLTVEALDGTLKQMMSGKITDAPLPLDDFNRRVVLFGRDGAQALGLANAMSKRAWTNVTYFPGSYADLAAALHQN
jgi:rhodanese-related sulfurtransferase